MSFDDMLKYEADSVQAAMGFSILNVNVHVHDTYSDCEDCGSYSSIVVTLSGDIEGQFGDHAHCFGWEDASWVEIAEFLRDEMSERGRVAPLLLSAQPRDEAEAAYYGYAFPRNAPAREDEQSKALGMISTELNLAYDQFYSMSNILHLFAASGIEFTVTTEEDEIYSARWEIEDDEEEECQDD